MVPSLLRVFARKGSDYKKTRVAATRVLVWLILQQGKMSATSFVLNGVDLMGIAEVRAELRSLKRRPSIVTADQKRKAHKAIIDRHVRAIFGRDDCTKRTRRRLSVFAPRISVGR